MCQEWQAGIRGVLYREIKNNRNFKKIGFGIFALKEYEEEKIKAITEKGSVSGLPPKRIPHPMLELKTV